MNHMPKYYFCTICLDIIENVVIINCGHKFCNVCFIRAIDLKNKCPLYNYINNTNDICSN